MRKYIMKKAKLLLSIVIQAIILASFALPAYANGTEATLILPDLISFSNGIGSVYQTDHETDSGFETYSYQCQTDYVETVVQEYIRELRTFGIYISQSEKTVYDSTNNDANYGIALSDMNRDRTKRTHKDDHGWVFHDVSVYIAFSTGGDYDSQYIQISYAKGSYRIADTGAKMQLNRRFLPSDYYFYRDQLKTDAQKEAYDYILSKTEEMKILISLAGLPARMNYDEFFLVWYSVLIDNPQIFMVASDTNIGEINYYDDGTVRSFCVHYCVDKNDLPSMKKAYEEAIAEALDVIDPYMTDYQKELALHDWLCKHTRYDVTLDDKSTRSYSAIVEKKAVCEGYSEAFTELLHRAGIDAATVYGYVYPEEAFPNNSHAWNIVCISGNWYYVDVTWDDTSPTSPLSHDYFNLTTVEISLDHKSAIGDFPICNSKDAAYGKSG